MQLLEEKSGNKLLDMGLNSDFLGGMTPKAQATKSKTNKWDYKLKSF